MKYQRKNLVSEQIDDQLILLDHETSRIIKLNSTASFIWNLLKRPLTIKEIVDKTTASYPDANTTEIKQLVKTLIKERII